jgi:eukaryotic-like serine/threonine-protein kinase
VSWTKGEIICGRYLVQGRIGKGGMGEVWACQDLVTRLPVAAKILLQRAARRPDLQKRFRREAKIAARIQSEYVCSVLDQGCSENGTHFIVFERLIGESLAERLKRELCLSFEETWLLVCDILRGLQAAHAVGVIHRDLKPGNIFLVEAQSPFPKGKLLDFGVSKMVSPSATSDDRSLTAVDATLGSFAYMAPEQVKGSAGVDERADIYALGVVAFRCLTSFLPFEAISAEAMVRAKIHLKAPHLRDVTGEHWPSMIEDFFTRALATERESRFGSAQETLEAWSAIKSGHEAAIQRAKHRVQGASAWIDQISAEQPLLNPIARDNRWKFTFVAPQLAKRAKRSRTLPIAHLSAPISPARTEENHAPSSIAGMPHFRRCAFGPQLQRSSTRRCECSNSVES